MEDNLSWLYMPVDSVPTPPVSTRVQLLPFSELDWKNFEKLCYRLVRLEANVEFSQLYGTQGSSQEGIDIYARLSTSEKYRVYQCKNEQDFGPAKIDTAVDVFFEGEWLQKSEQFILCTRESLRSTTARSNAVEKQASILKEFGVSLLCWDEEELSSRLKLQPEIVDDFFGRAWVKAFCGEEEANKLNNRLNITEVNILRSRLLSLYERVFNKHDRGIPLSDTLPISQRYIIPDIEDFQTLSPILETEFVQAKQDISDSNSTLDASKPLSITSRGTTRRYIQRLPIQNWITKSKKSLLLGDPGSGKSTFLRFLSMDLLKDCPSFTTVVEKWGGYLPLWIPFAIWTKIIKEGNVSERSVKGVLSCWLKSWDEEDLVPLIENALKDKRLLLLVDGLDEHSDVESAKVALTHLETFLAANDIAVIATTRPNGFEKLEIKTDSWQKARIAGLSQDQQKELVKIWFTASSHKMNPSLGEATRLKDVEREIDIFFGELSRSNELKELAHNALLLSLLISFQISHIRLPLGRFKVYQELTNHLILTHPEIRRLSAGVTSEQSLNENDLKKTLAHLANIIHEQYPEGIIKEDEALKVLVDFLMDDVQGLGMSRYIATETGRNILTRAEDQLGIIVKKTQDEIGFYHRTIQEYLVSFCIARFSLDKQKSIVAQRCTDHMWKDVILGLFQITNSPQDVSSIIESIQIKKLSQLEKRNVFELLSEIVFGDYNCPPNLAREISKDIFTQIELETFNPYREKLLKHVLNGLRSSIMSDVVKEKIQSWFPNRTGWSTSYIFSEMSNWNRGVDLLECLFKALHAEEYVTKQRAAITLAKLWKGDLEVYKKLVDLVNYSEDPYVVSAVVECLTLGWNSEPELLSIFKRLSKSLSPTLRLVVRIIKAYHIWYAFCSEIHVWVVGNLFMQISRQLTCGLLKKL